MKRILEISLSLMVTTVMVVVAIVAGFGLWDYYLQAPWTRDGRVRADVVAVTPDVSGLVTEVMVTDNQAVRRGDILFRIDPERFTLALRQAEAIASGKQAVSEQTKLNYQRYVRLTDAAASQEKIDQAKAAADEADAAYREAVADSDLARLNLARAEVHASVNGRITNMSLQPGAYVSVGKGVMALIDEDTVRIEGYFEETKLSRIHVGDKANIRLAGDKASLSGHIESIAGGIEDRERTSGASLLADVNPTFSWVRLAQRIPVRIALDPLPKAGELVSGRTATVSIIEPVVPTLEKHEANPGQAQ